MHDPITNHAFKTVEPTAIKTENGNWVTLIPRCEQRVLCPPKGMILEKNFFGCATADNLGMMVSHPQDFVAPEKTRDYIVHNKSNALANIPMQGG